MGSIGSFADEFWNKEIGDYTGWEIVQQHIKDGNKVTLNYIDLLKQVTSAMDVFGRSLIKTARSSSLPELENGKLKEALQTARRSVEAFGQDTLEAASALTGQISSLTQHINQAKDARKKTEEEVKAHQHQVNDATRRVKQMKRTAQVKLKEKMDCENQKFVIESKIDAKAKDIEKVMQADKRAEENVANAEQHHREAINKQNESLEEWRSVTRNAFIAMQDVEETRVKIVRDSLWSVANICSLLAVHYDQHQENIRLSLMNVNVRQELSSWIKLYRTTQAQPTPVIYRAIERPTFSTPLSTPANSTRSTVTEIDDSSTSRSRSGTATPEPLHEATVLYHFAARSESEMSLQVGETISVLDDSNADWIYVKNKTGRIGFVPSKFIQPLPHD